MRRLMLLWLLLTTALLACRLITPTAEGTKRPVVPPLATAHSTLPIEKTSIAAAVHSASWGRLANPGFENRRIETTLFFAGQAKDGSKRYCCDTRSNVLKYTVHPADERHLQWSESRDNQDFALSAMKEAGINVISMSSWGEHNLPCNKGWPISAPMQTAPEAHDELFAAAVREQLLIMPFIESRKKQWNFYDEFPYSTDGRAAPGTVSQIIDLINRYLKNAGHPEWAGRWAKVYDRNGEPRYAVVIIHAASNRLAEEHALYAEGFNIVAEEVFNATRVNVGFFIDAVPPGTYAPGQFKPSPEETGPFLYGTDAVLGIQCFIPEIWTGLPWDSSLIRWKRDFSRRWYDTGIPFIMDVSPGYDNHLVFPWTPIRYGHTAAWRQALTGMVADFGKNGFVYNSWNGYTEAMTAVPLREPEYGDIDFRWLQSLR